MTEPTVGTVLVGTADVVQIGCAFNDHKIRFLGGADMAAESVHTQGMVPIMTAPGLCEPLMGPLADALHNFPV